MCQIIEKYPVILLSVLKTVILFRSSIWKCNTCNAKSTLLDPILSQFYLPPILKIYLLKIYCLCYSIFTLPFNWTSPTERLLLFPTVIILKWPSWNQLFQCYRKIQQHCNTNNRVQIASLFECFAWLFTSTYCNIFICNRINEKFEHCSFQFLVIITIPL